MKPLGKNVLVEWDQAEESRIIVPGGGPERPNTGVVKDVGAKVDELTEGDKVLFTDSFSSKPVPGYKDLLVMHEDSIMLIL